MWHWRYTLAQACFCQKHSLVPYHFASRHFSKHAAKNKSQSWQNLFGRIAQQEKCKLIDPYPKYSQDFNAMKNAWFTLKQRLDQTMPTKLEGRDEFIKRLKDAVRWANKHRSKHLWDMSTNQKQRAEDCLATTPPGGRTTW